MSSRQEEKERRKRERQEREAAAESVRRQTQAHADGVRRRIGRAGRRRSGRGSGLRRRWWQRRPVGRGSRGLRGDPRPEGLRHQGGGRGRRLHPQGDLPNEGAGHVEKDFKASDYKQNPPTSGNHFPQWAQDGVYDAGDTPDLGQLVHTLEHGRIDVQYKPGTPAETVAQLETFMKENEDGYHMLLFQNPHEHAVRGRRDRLGPPARLQDHEPARSSTRSGPSARPTSTRAPRSCRR